MPSTDDFSTKVKSLRAKLKLSQEDFAKALGALFRYIHKVFQEGELVKNSVGAKFATTAVDDKTY